MVRLFLCIILIVFTTGAAAQKVVNPADLVLTVTLENTSTTPYQQEMVLLTIHGIYRRHITLENLENPDFADINWMQLGADHWFESTLNGKKVKNMRRRMALFPEKNGNLEIGSFVHHLTLLDENNQWFEHKIKSDPIRLQVQPAPDTADWWFPVRKLEISDRWSNAPDQLKQGEGVLRVITLTAVGVGPDMLPPMPELKSPSAHIFPHPEKRLVQLSPQGPISIGIWRWTIKPRNPPSAILEPLEFSYFNTVERKMKSAVISAQRIAMVEIDTPSAKQEEGRPPVALKSVLLRIFVAMALIAGLTLILGTKRVISLDFLQQRLRQFKLKSKLKRGVKARNLQIIRQAGRALHSHAKSSDDCRQLLDHLDERIFSRTKDEFDVKGFYKRFKATL